MSAFAMGEPLMSDSSVFQLCHCRKFAVHGRDTASRPQLLEAGWSGELIEHLLIAIVKSRFILRK